MQTLRNNNMSSKKKSIFRRKICFDRFHHCGKIAER